MNLEQARSNMVEQQIRPWEVLDQDVLDLLYTVPREEFMPAACRNLAFCDLEVPVGEGEKMWPPKLEARVLQALAPRRSERVLEVGRLRRERRSGGKTDALDAVRAARSALTQERPATPRAGGERQALQALVAAREGAVNAKRAGLCQLRDLVITTPEPLRSELRPLTRARLLQRLAATRPDGRRDPELRGSMLALRSIARRVLQLTAEERELAREIETLTRKLAPQLLAQPGVGPLAAAQVLISWSHRGRIRSEAAFARLAGCAPIPASSGQTVRYRLDRGGDRRLNRALHMILVTRRRAHAPTIAYINRRIQEGKSRREATRCLKRYLARNLYRLLENPPMPT